MKHYMNFYFFIIALAFISCEDNSTDPSDKAISTMILGKWVANNSEVIFYSDGTSKSTSISYYNLNNPQKDSLIFISFAKYKIENNILFSTDLNIQITASTDTVDVAIAKLIPTAIEINGDSLISTPVNVFDKIDGAPNVLDGRWFTKFDCFMINPNVTITMGKEELDYHFDSQNQYYSLSIKLNLNGVGYDSNSGNYVVENGFLNMGGANYYKMKIDSKRLYLFNNHSFKLIKSN